MVLEKETAKKPSAPATTTAAKVAASPSKEAPAKRKPRKLNKEPISTSAVPTPGLSNEAAELEALKSRVRGLEAKVEDLYKATPPTTTPRSPGAEAKAARTRVRQRQPRLATWRRKRQATPQVQEIDDEEEADEELERLESELEVARHDLQQYRPRARRSISENADGEFVEEIAREAPPGVNTGSDRQVTLSGSYRIPLPANLNPEDVKTIQSGVSAAQNVARSFLDQRRANQALKTAQAETPAPPQSARAKTTRKARQEPSVELSTQMDTGAGKQSWGEWIGGYSMAISRAVKTIEHEAAMEAKTERPGQARGTSTPKGSGTGAKKNRPAPKTTLSGEQVQGLMS